MGSKPSPLPEPALAQDAVILSDMHLGSENCQAKQLCSFLEKIVEGELATARLILNGDVFESIDFRRLKKNHWKVLSLIRKLSDQMEIVWICGNHDGSAEIISHLLGTAVQEEYILRSGKEQILILHGHRFDRFLDEHPWVTLLGDLVYYLLLRVDRTHRVARLAKKSSKTFLRCSEKIREESKQYARRKQCTAVCCGHTHHALTDGSTDIAYFNSGCWTELPGTYLTVCAGRIDLHAFEAPPLRAAADATWSGDTGTPLEGPVIAGPVARRA